jgi:hypothetical protein
MIVWVSSYPRSGNSLLEFLLSHVFLLHGTSRYFAIDMTRLAAEARKIPPHDLVSRYVRFSYDLPGPWEEFRAAAQQAVHPIYIKTHELRDDDSRTIYVVRDPRSTLVSYLHFLRRENPELAITMDQVIRGTVGYGSWSAHLESWQPDQRPGTLLLRYEDLTESPDLAIEALANFVGCRPLRPWVNRFAEFNAYQPGFYRSGSNSKNISELSAAELDLIEAIHGPWMRRLGYPTK